MIFSLGELQPSQHFDDGLVMASTNGAGCTQHNSWGSIGYYAFRLATSVGSVKVVPMVMAQSRVKCVVSSGLLLSWCGPWNQ